MTSASRRSRPARSRLRQVLLRRQDDGGIRKGVAQLLLMLHAALAVGGVLPLLLPQPLGGCVHA